MKYLVIGGGGFIGSYVVDKLLYDESISKVIVYDNFCSGKKWHLKEHKIIKSSNWLKKIYLMVKYLSILKILM